MSQKLYPLKFEPILKERIWGGNKLAKFLNKKSDSDQVGESWEISDVEGDSSIVVNGSLKGNSLKDIQLQYGAELLGEKNFKIFQNRFPLLIKFIDAKKDLSIQLHPNDKLALKRHNSYGKTEMWYIMEADDHGKLIVDFNQSMDKKKYLGHLKNKSLPEVLNFENVKNGDTYLIEAGRVHAIGAGVMLVEIQQTSDLTYRLYDWDRVDTNGNSRDLHIDLALDAIDFKMPDNYKISYHKIKNVSNEMVKHSYFTTNYIELTKDLIKYNNLDSFIIYICVDGQVEIQTDGFLEVIEKGGTILLPAALKTYTIKSNSAKLLEVYI